MLGTYGDTVAVWIYGTGRVILARIADTWFDDAAVSFSNNDDKIRTLA